MQKKRMKMAIITRTKNRNLLLERALRSVASQTSKEYVHVVLNDGGNKQAVEKLLQKYPNDNRVVIHNETTSGLTPALNKAIRAVDSVYISILDDDDSWAPERVEIVNKFMDEHRSKGAVVVMDRIVEEISAKGDSVREVSRDRWLDGVTTVSLYEQCLHNYLSNGSFNYTRKVYEELGGYDELLGVAEDWDFGIRYLLRYDTDFINTKEALAYYHHRPTQKGDTGNSVFAGIDEHAKNLNSLRNKHLRQDIQSGRLGIGYIMNDLAYRYAKEKELERKDLEKVVRIEGHINHAVKASVEDIKQLTIRSGILYQIKKKIPRKG
jgi:glycosyltransferase involved in cell wall biosynthesis